MIPGLLLLILVLQRFAASPQRPHALRLLISGSVILFFGGMLYVFVFPHDFGAAFYVSLVGLATLLAGLVTAILALVTTQENADTVTQANPSPVHGKVKVS